MNKTDESHYTNRIKVFTEIIQRDLYYFKYVLEEEIEKDKVDFNYLNKKFYLFFQSVKDFMFDLDVLLNEEERIEENRKK